ncbi:SIS domain-containing protein [Gilliamella apis]|uniref:Carbohydrate isomerase n=1 Tax=Gilliamella apis TaxID=1970738 RepID=A0A242NWU2_9GAMM|nr:SIS domain-containing protein [Gilliamella apis]OTQ52773.1 carbohydrate isomerase [Gilliamella apis]
MLEKYIDCIKSELSEYIKYIGEENLNKAKDLIITKKNEGSRVHVTGIGKPSYVAHYIASLFSSIGIPAYFLDGTETIHGSAGQVLPDDIVIAISNSGETEELKKAICTLQKLGTKIIGVAGNNNSWLAQHCDIFLFAGVKQEGDNLNKPPRISILAEVIILQCLSIKLQEAVGLTENMYYQWHPGGSLGASLRGGKVC